MIIEECEKMEMNCKSEFKNKQLTIYCGCEQVLGVNKCTFINKKGNRRKLKLIRKNMNSKKLRR